MSRQVTAQAPQQAATAKAAGGLLQRKCGCGTHTIGGAECDGCRAEGRKLKRAAVNHAEASDAQPDAQARPRSGHGFNHDLSRVPVTTPERAASASPTGGYDRMRSVVSHYRH